jgi:hypothetical protein
MKISKQRVLPEKKQPKAKLVLLAFCTCGFVVVDDKYAMLWATMDKEEMKVMMGFRDASLFGILPPSLKPWQHKKKKV